MAELVRPFAALRPTAASAAEVVAPPYDVVSTDEARALAAGRPRSFLHISRPEIDLPEGSSPYSDAAYAQGARSLERLVAERVLVRDDQPSFYIYRMVMNGRTQTGVAFAASVRAYEQQRIRRHELTRPDKENDRVRNIATLNAQTGPVLLAYRANDALRELLAIASNAAPLFSVTGPNDVVHTVWATAPATDATLASRARRARRAVHRRRSSSLGRRGARRGAAARLARREPRVLSRRRVPARRDAHPRLQPRRPRFERLVARRAARAHPRVVRRHGAARRTLAAATRDVRDVSRRPVVRAQDSRRRSCRAHDPVASLDISLLQDRLLAPILGVGDPRTDARIDFVGGVRGLAELERRVQSGRAAVAFALHATRMEQLMAVADAGKLMPPKSTWFEPKLADGLLSHVLD